MVTRVALIGSRGYPSTYSGFETLVRQLAPFLAETGFDVTVYGRNGPGGCDEHALMPAGVHSVVTQGVHSKALSTLTHGFTASLHAQRVRYDAALVVNVANGFYLPILRRAGIRTVVNVDGLEWTRAKWNTAGRAVFRLGAAATAKWADGIVIDSEALRPVWGGEFPVQTTFIPYGADVVLEVDPRPVRDMGLDPSSYVLAVARLVPENNVDTFLDAIARLPSSVPVVLVGSGQAGTRLVDRVQAESTSRVNFRWLGHVADQVLLGALWAHCGAYWHGHSVGGTNPSLLQALGYGAPTVAVDTAFNREVLFPQTRQLIPAQADVLARRITSLLDDPALARQFSLAGQALVGSRYQWDSVCKAYGSILRESLT